MLKAWDMKNGNTRVLDPCKFFVTTYACTLVGIMEMTNFLQVSEHLEQLLHLCDPPSTKPPMKGNDSHEKMKGKMVEGTRGEPRSAGRLTPRRLESRIRLRISRAVRFLAAG